LNHLNFSGMNFNGPSLQKLIKMLKQCQFLLGIHLSDNNITNVYYNKDTQDYDYDEQFYLCIAEFDITDLDLIAINR